MAWIFGQRAAALLLAAGLAGLAGPCLPEERPAIPAEYRRPDAIPFPDSNPYSQAKAELGRNLFFDPLLSGSGDRSCASCHQPGLAWSDGRARAARSDAGEMALHTPSLLDIAFADGPLGWDGKFPSLETVAFAPITAPTNMNLSEAALLDRLAARPDYTEAFAAAFPDARPAIARKTVEEALATFERLIVSGRAPFDAWVAGDAGAISDAAKRGFGLFTGKAHCAACHSGSSFTDGSFHDIGTASGEGIGRGRFFPNAPALRFAFKTPTLRDVARRGAYMHDGSLATLSEVIDLYDRGGIDRPSRSRDIRPLGLTAPEKADLLAFLDTLSGPAESHPALGTLGPQPPRP
ncbi:c-type cytochrome [Methylobacterium organophilum]|uniref:cytochrome-c peroxidase n=1 Tax=Methylobacterium organophilum TaxID=410 RepID=UPI001F12CFA5|nr:cytochrome c peroxidase [Methylobacterium organophilum]UMY18240.1 c-type cytochrome [Methylobacterium organophilum]